MRLASSFVFVMLLTVTAAEAQVADTTSPDTAAYALPPIEVVGTIRPDAGPTVGSGVPVVSGCTPTEATMSGSRSATANTRGNSGSVVQTLSAAPTCAARIRASTPPRSSASSGHDR